MLTCKTLEMPVPVYYESEALSGWLPRGSVWVVSRPVMVETAMIQSRKRSDPPQRPITFRVAEDLGAFELAQLWAQTVPYGRSTSGRHTTS